MALTTNAPKIAEEVATMLQSVTLREAAETRAQEQWSHAVSWTVNVLAITGHHGRAA